MKQIEGEEAFFVCQMFGVPWEATPFKEVSDDKYQTTLRTKHPCVVYDTGSGYVVYERVGETLIVRDGRSTQRVRAPRFQDLRYGVILDVNDRGDDAVSSGGSDAQA